MSTRQSTIDYLLEQIDDAGVITSRKMFGEYAVYCDGKVIALVCDDQVFIKPTPEGRAFVGEVVEGYPFPGAKPWIAISGDQWDNRRWASQLVAITAAALPEPVIRRRRRKGSTPLGS
jgi:TfoX/Sxy family transcriptional regulator of competence genes